MSLVACSPDTSGSSPAGGVQLLPLPGEGVPVHEVAAAHRALLRALNSGEHDAASLLSDDFTLIDAANPDARSRDFTGRPVFGFDRFRVLSRPHPQLLQVVDSMHLYPTDGDDVLVVAHHARGSRTVARWHRRSGDWQVSRLTLNASAEMVERIEAWFGSVALRQQ